MTFGTAAATDVSGTDTALTVTTPPHAAGPVTVTVRTVLGVSPPGPGALYRYYPTSVLTGARLWEVVNFPEALTVTCSALVNGSNTPKGRVCYRNGPPAASSSPPATCPPAGAEISIPRDRDAVTHAVAQLDPVGLR